MVIVEEISASTAMMAFDPPRAIPFIVPCEDEHDTGGFRVTDEAIALLQSIATPVAPVAVCGRYRTGKSFLLNRLIGAPARDGFEVGPTVEACTRGIWLWSEPKELILTDGTRVSALFMDTEGMGGYGATAEHDARIFALAVLLCSLVVYNSVGAIDEEAIQSLAFVANLTKHIQLQAAGKGGGGGDDAQSLTSAADEAARHNAAAGGSRLTSSRDSDDDTDDDEEDDDATVDSDAESERHNNRGAARGGAANGAGRPPRLPGTKATSGKQQPIRSKHSAPFASTRGSGSNSRDGASSVASGRSWGGSSSLVASGALNSEISDFFPSFLWVLRDFALDLVDELGEALSPKDYLEQCLGVSGNEGFSSAAQARNRTRRVLTTFFKERACETLVRPVDDEATLQKVDSLPDRELRPRFRRELKHLRKRVLGELLKPKSLGGEPVTGRLLAGLAQAYVEAINAKGVPSIGNAWDGVTRGECQEALEAAGRSFAEGVEAQLSEAHLPLDEPALKSAFDAIAADALRRYDGRAVGPAAAKYREELADRIGSHWGPLQASNAVASEAACAKLVARLWAEIIEPNLSTSASSSDAVIPSAIAAASAAASGASNAPAGSGAASSSTSAETAAASAAAGTASKGGKSRERAARRKSHAAGATAASSDSSTTPPAAPGASASSTAVVAATGYCDHSALAADLDRLKPAYFAAARGPAVYSVLSSFLLSALPPLVRAVNAARATEAEGRLAALQAELGSARVAAAEATSRLLSLQSELTALRDEREAAQLSGAGAAAKVAGAEAAALRLQSRVKELEREVVKLQAAAAKQQQQQQQQQNGAMVADGASAVAARRRPSQASSVANASAPVGSIGNDSSVADSGLNGSAAASSERKRGRSVSNKRRKSQASKSITVDIEDENASITTADTAQQQKHHRRSKSASAAAAAAAAAAASASSATGRTGDDAPESMAAAAAAAGGAASSLSSAVSARRFTSDDSAASAARRRRGRSGSRRGGKVDSDDDSAVDEDDEDDGVSPRTAGAAARVLALKQGQQAHNRDSSSCGSTSEATGSGLRPKGGRGRPMEFPDATVPSTSGVGCGGGGGGCSVQ